MSAKISNPSELTKVNYFMAYVKPVAHNTLSVDLGLNVGPRPAILIEYFVLFFNAFKKFHNNALN
jgi:hypothetical protein